jgi:hypothetical protein
MFQIKNDSDAIISKPDPIAITPTAVAFAGTTLPVKKKKD